MLVRPLPEAGYWEIIVARLPRKTNGNAKTEWRRAVKNLDCCRTAFHHVCPREGFDGSLEAALTVNPEITRERIALGYWDAMMRLSKLTKRK